MCRALALPTTLYGGPQHHSVQLLGGQHNQESVDSNHRKGYQNPSFPLLEATTLLFPKNVRV
jgi:hypothetical protein